MEEEEEGGEMDRYVDSENNLWREGRLPCMKRGGRFMTAPHPFYSITWDAPKINMRIENIFYPNPNAKYYFGYHRGSQYIMKGLLPKIKRSISCEEDSPPPPGPGVV